MPKLQDLLTPGNLIPRVPGIPVCFCRPSPLRRSIYRNDVHRYWSRHSGCSAYSTSLESVILYTYAVWVNSVLTPTLCFRRRFVRVMKEYRGVPPPEVHLAMSKVGGILVAICTFYLNLFFRPVHETSSFCQPYSGLHSRPTNPCLGSCQLSRPYLSDQACSTYTPPSSPTSSRRTGLSRRLRWQPTARSGRALQLHFHSLRVRCMLDWARLVPRRSWQAWRR